MKADATPDRERLSLPLRNGRKLGYAIYGNADAPESLFYFHGLPGSRLEARRLDTAARGAGFRVIAVDRPGYGLSTPAPGRGWLDWAADVVELADAVQAARFGILAVSGGGPFALTCAHALPDRVNRIALVCPLGPVTDHALRRAMHWRFRVAFELAERSPALLRLIYVSPVRLFAGQAPHLLELLGSMLGGKDGEVLREPATSEWLAENLRESLREHGEGSIEDARLQTQPWPFDLTSIHVPVTFWHGDADPVVPLIHSRYMHDRIPGSKLHIVQGEGHFSLPIRYVERVIAALRERQ